MKERPILFSGEMVHAVLEGRKTQTRRVLNPQPFPPISGKYPPSDPFLCDDGIWRFMCGQVCYDHNDIRCPFGLVGDRLWCRENVWRDERASNVVIYAATPEWAKYDDGTRGLVRASYPDDSKPPTREQMQKEMESNRHWHLKPSIHMPRWASRITLEVTEIRVERLQDISEADAVAEGFEGAHYENSADDKAPSDQFGDTWNKLHWKTGHSWHTNPWVWVIEFKRVEQQQAVAA